MEKLVFGGTMLVSLLASVTNYSGTRSSYLLPPYFFTDLITQ